jgi:4-amino-4-deoxy-L-arabinose transferase-like glycosyltransferase
LFEKIKDPFLLVCLGLSLAFLLGRFVSLDAMPGFYIDEAAGAAHIKCMSDTGHNADGEKWPLYSNALGTGHTSPPYLYIASTWVKAFGSSRYALRALSLTFSVLTILICALIVLQLADGRAAGLCLLLGAAAPMSYHFSLIAWDPPLAPLFLVTGFYFLISDKKCSAIAGGLFFALAAYAYPPARMHLALLLIVSLLFHHQMGISKRKVISSALVGLAFCLPLFYLMSQGELMDRYQIVGVFGAHFASQHPDFGVADKLIVVFQNFLKHFTWSYLFVSGDPNLRHSSGMMGTFSYFSYATLLLGLLVTAYSRLELQRNFPWYMFLICLAGFIPAAFTWEGLPHSLRSISVWPFWIMFVALCARILVENGTAIKAGVITLAVLNLVFNFYIYTYVFPTKAADYFDERIWLEGMHTELSGYEALPNLYFDMQFRQKACQL